MTIKEMESYAKENRVPIMMSDGIDYLCNLIKERKIKTILEVGSAIGYSAIRMALVNDDIYVTTIEKDEERYKIAKDNIIDNNLENRIKIFNEDALYFNTKDKFDLIFIDASKGNNINFFEKYKDNLSKCGIIVTDNLSFHGLVEDESLIETKNQRKLVEKIKLFIDFLDQNKDFQTNYVSVGDKIAISKRREENEL